MLYLLASPIGNLKDLSVRFKETLSQLDELYCEDTRVTGNLLRFLNVKLRLIRYDDYLEQKLMPEILTKLQNGHNLGLISDAGVPTISDPGFKLVRACSQNKIPVTIIPGPSAVTASLAVSGLPTDNFMFFGFLPKKTAHLEKILNKFFLLNEIQKTTFIFFESPYRIISTLKCLDKKYPQCQLVVCRELTKIHEEIMKGKPSEVLSILEKRSRVKGEITLLLNLNVGSFNL